ncbi:ubiquitin ligase (cullin) of SCF [Blastocladiella emersonii ATCC 22665]|nr:ubiquitin ligase (cullin) of SCF [Blastocladiella emersonii ATCC 22665]
MFNANVLSGEEVWARLRDDVYQLVRHPENGLDPKRYMNIYTLVYNHCTSKPPAGASVGTPGSVQSNVMGRELYQSLQALLETFMGELVEGCSGLMDIDLLAFYTREWNKYTQAAKFLDHLFQYLNRHWVKRKIDDNHEGIYRIHTMALVIWKASLFERTSGPLVDAVLRQIETERNGESVDRSMLKAVLDSFVALDLPNGDAVDAGTAQGPETYKHTFEDKFLTATSTYYKAESSKFLAENSVTEYMKKAETRLAEELDRVKMYLHASTEATLIRLCEERLILDHDAVLRDEFQVLLASDKNEDMERMYRLVSRTPDRLEPLRGKLEVYVSSIGKQAVEKVAGDLSDDAPLDAKVYVDALLVVYHKYASLVARAFQGDAGFVGSLDRACREFVNRNAVTETAPSKSSELLARYSDSLLKKSAKNPEEAELEELLTSIMTVFKFIEDRDVFQKFYSKMLAKRLVGGLSASTDSEELMINKLKDACGFEYVSKLQRMFTDMGVSRDLNADFQSKMAQTHGPNAADMVDFQVMVLSTASWPFTAPPTEFQLPTELVRTYDRFTQYYNHKHSGRRLTWLHHQSKGDLKAQFPKSKATYLFGVSMYQMGILLQYNNADKYTYEEIKELTKLNDAYIQGYLGILVKAKILLLEGESVGAPGSTYALNVAYNNKKTRMNLNVPIKAEIKTETDDTNKTVEEDRKLFLQAAIVRVMKTRRLLKHQALIQEVITQAQSRFKPKISDIKKCIDLCIDKEYMERVEGEKDTYSYIA